MAAFAHDDAYIVNLPVFEGPLDLLLQLIERAKLDISVVSLAQVTDQFLDHVRALPDVPASVLAGFLTVAARLVWIKSRLLLPQPRQADEEVEEDPGEALARQLREYKRFKEAADALRAIEAEGRRTYGRAAPPPELQRRLDPDPSALSELLAAARNAFSSASALPVDIPDGMVVPFTLTIQDQIRLIRRTTAHGGRVTFRGLLSQAYHRLEVIVTLLAVLELLKRSRIHVVQDESFGEIYIEGLAAAGDAEDDEIEDGTE
ncbi:MAG: Segregation and condensation protein A [Chloroflexi bacterium ADurb.Bin325]|nr:MAG: Segregation and condensation protein A [Chloroflexi bacterium ADurb.Bin325]